MKCISAARCTDETCKHKEEHVKNDGCEYHCHHSDFHLMCQPTSRGIMWVIDKLRIRYEVWKRDGRA